MFASWLTHAHCLPHPIPMVGFSSIAQLYWYTCYPHVWLMDKLLQFISSIMVSFSFLSYVALICSLVCILTIGYILWFFWVLWTLLLSNSDPRRSPSITTGRDYTYWLILLTLILDSLVFRPILSYRTRISYYSLIPPCSMEFYAYASPSISRQLHVL